MNWMDFKIKYNYWVDQNPVKASISLIGPWLTAIIVGSILNNIFKIHILILMPFYILSTFYLIFLLIVRQLGSIDIRLIDSESKEFKKICLYFSNKWLRRGWSQFIYIKPIDNYRINLYVHNLRYPRVFSIPENWNQDSFYKSFWGEWSLSSTRIATEKEIKEYNLEVKEAKILLEI